MKGVGETHVDFQLPTVPVGGQHTGQVVGGPFFTVHFSSVDPTGQKDKLDLSRLNLGYIPVPVRVDDDG